MSQETQVTLVAFYGEKSEAFKILISNCQKILSDTFQNEFEPYDIMQIHATFISLKHKEGNILENEAFSKHRIQGKEMDIDGYLDYLRNASSFPIEVQIGGFQSRHYPFVSDSKTPYERSFSIAPIKDRKTALLIGWPIWGKPFVMPPNTSEEKISESRLYPLHLQTMRHDAQRYNILHDYHKNFTDIDNDFYFRIGLFQNEPSKLLKEKIEDRIRKELSASEPLILQITLDDIWVVAYKDETLPYNPDNCRCWKLTHKEIVESFILKQCLDP